MFCYETWTICEDELRPYIQPVLQKASYMSNRCFKMISVFSDGLVRVQVQRWARPTITDKENMLADKF